MRPDNKTETSLDLLPASLMELYLDERWWLWLKITEKIE